MTSNLFSVLLFKNSSGSKVRFGLAINAFKYPLQDFLIFTGEILYVLHYDFESKPYITVTSFFYAKFFALFGNTPSVEKKGVQKREISVECNRRSQPHRLKERRQRKGLSRGRPPRRITEIAKVTFALFTVMRYINACYSYDFASSSTL